MPERGGPTTQSGILYQNSVTALYLGRLCDTTGRLGAHSVVRVRAEAPSRVDDIVVWYADGHVTYVQVKERLGVRDAAWTDLWRAFAAQFKSSAFQAGRDRLLLHLGALHGGEAEDDHALCEACDRARTADSTAEWRDRLTARQRELVAAIETLLAPTLALTDESARAFFAHVEVVPRRTLTEIERDLVPHWMPVVSVEPHTLFRLLRDRVGDTARVRGDFTALTLRAELGAEHGVRFPTDPDAAALRAAAHACGALLRQHKATLGGTGLHVPRPVAREVVEWALDLRAECRVGLLLDHAGRGKTVVMRDVLAELEARGATVLAIKADQQLSGVADAAALQVRLGLPEPLERVVRRLAHDGPVVVIVDQLDALSLSLARDQHALDVVLGAIARVREVPGAAVLLSCRTFDRHTDPRLKRIEVGREFSVPLLGDGDVARVCTALGLNSAALSLGTRELLRTPLHLDLFAALAAPDHDPARLHGVQSLQDLYGLLWEDVVLGRAATGGSPAARERVLRTVTERMHRDQRTSVPRSVITVLPDADAAAGADALASSGLLVASPTEWSLLHQTFFDYCYARFFVEDGGDLVTAVLESDQGLFTRPQVVQVLTYLRGSDPTAYADTLQRLLDAPGLRAHLRDLVLRWAGALLAPSDAEWWLIYRRLLDPGLRAATFRAMAGNPAWLPRLTARALAGLLGGDASLVDGSVVPYLASNVNTDAQTAVAELVRPWLARPAPWPARAGLVTQAVRAWRTPQAIALFEAVVAQLPLEQVRYMFELDDVAVADPAAGARLVRGLLDRILDAYCAEPAGVARTFRGIGDALEALNGSAGPKAIEIVSSTAPRLFLDAMVPWLEQVVAADRERGDRTRDRFYDGDPLMTSVGEYGRVVGPVLVDAYVTALVGLARADVPGFRDVGGRLATLPFTTPQFILTRVYRELATERADDAAAFVVGDPRRLRLGPNDAYESRQLLRALAPLLTGDQFLALEQFVLAETGHPLPWPELASLRWRGTDQLHLLRELPYGRLTAETRARLRELERKFPNEQAVDSPTTMRGGVVGPPIPTAACARMSDAAWLGAMAKYAGGVQHKEFLRGGATELARVLQAQVKADPARFARLAAAAPDGLDDAYVAAFIDGLAESEGPPEWVYTVVRRFATPARLGVHRSAAWALGKLTSRAGGLPADLLDLLEGWVRGPARQDEAFYAAQQQDLQHAVLNTDRGAALRTLMHALGQDDAEAALRRRWALAEHVAGDPSVVLRASGVEALLYLLEVDRLRATGVFERTVEDQPRLRATHAYQEFLYYGTFRQFVRLAPYLRDLMHAEAPDARRRGAELAVLNALSTAGPEDPATTALATDLEQQAVAGEPEWRRGAANVYAHNWADDPLGRCEVGLRRLFDDPDGEVRRTAAWMTHKLRPEHAVTRQDFLLAFAVSRAARAGAHHFAEYLWEHGLVEPAWALAVVEALLDAPHDEDDGAGWFAGGDDLVRTVLRVYTGATRGEALRERAMTVFDRLMERFAGDALAALAEWDRG